MSNYYYQCKDTNYQDDESDNGTDWYIKSVVIRNMMLSRMWKRSSLEIVYMLNSYSDNKRETFAKNSIDSSIVT